MNLAIAQPTNSNQPVGKGTAVPSSVSAGLGGVCVVACCIVQEIKVFPESPQRLRCITKYDRTCRYGLYQVGTENALASLKLDGFEQKFSCSA